MTLILASASPRRHELLSRLELAFQVVPSTDPERPARAGEQPGHYARSLARSKALAIAQDYPNDVILGADTVVACGTQILGKPASTGDAFSMLSMLRGQEHKVTTGLVGVGNGRSTSRSRTARVWMREYSDEDIRRYIATGEPMDKAGAYAVQGIGQGLVERVSGCFYTVVGLPLCALVAVLADLGVDSGVLPGVVCTHYRR